MKYVKLVAEADGNSRWRDVDVALRERSFAPPAQAIEISDSLPASAALFLRLRAGWNQPVHPTPLWQTLICVAGAVRVTASNGEARDIGPGDVWMMQDTSGQGHHTKVISAEDFECVIVQHG